MPLFSKNNGNLSRVNERKIDLEKTVQKLTEDNLSKIFGLEFVSSEFALRNLRIDSLAFNPETNSFVIIEYKRDRSFSIVDQGFAYLSLMLNQKADFILEYNEKTSSALKKDDIDWSQSKIIFIANSFTTYQREAISFKDLQFELWEAKEYDNDTILYNQLRADESSASIKTVTKSNVIQQVAKELTSYTAERLFQPNWDQTKEIFSILREQLLELDSRIQEDPKKHYIGYKIDNSLVISFRIYKLGVEIQFKRSKPEDFSDPEGKVTYIKDSMRFYNQHLSSYVVHSADEIDYGIMLCKQAIKRHDSTPSS